MRKPTLMDLIMAQHVEMPGFPQLIVTRHFVYDWLAGLGWSKDERGFGSLDYTTFGRSEVAAPLTEASERDYWLGKVTEDYRR